MSLKIEQVAVVGPEPIYSPYGYVVVADGTIYSLTEQSTHGVILALLFPEEAEAHGIGAPDEDYCVFRYQKFELDRHDDLPVIRVSFGLVSDFNVSKGRDPATPEQIQAMSKILLIQEKGLNETVQTDLREMTARSMLRELTRKGGWYDDEY